MAASETLNKELMRQVLDKMGFSNSETDNSPVNEMWKVLGG
jgi:hypothetical protein